jgi:hypothetical protein
MKQSERKEKKEARNKKDGKGGEEEEAPVEDENKGIHPARLAMMQNIDRPTHRQRY